MFIIKSKYLNNALNLVFQTWSLWLSIFQFSNISDWRSDFTISSYDRMFVVL